MPLHPPLNYPLPVFSNETFNGSNEKSYSRKMESIQQQSVQFSSPSFKTKDNQRTDTETPMSSQSDSEDFAEELLPFQMTNHNQ